MLKVSSVFAEQRSHSLRFVQIETLPSGKALVDIDKLTHAVPQDEGTRLFLRTQYVDVPHTLDELENVLVERERTDAGASGTAGFHVR